MKRLLIIALIFLVIIGLAIGIYVFFRSKNNADKLVLYGNVDVRQVDIGFRVSGQVEELYFEEGDLVPEGKLMAKLNVTPYDSQLEEAQARMESVQANLANSEILLKRRQELIGSGSVSQEDLDDALASRNSLLSDYAAAKSAVKTAEDNLTYTKAFAPTEGVILSRVREPGTVVNISDPVYILSVSSPVWVRAYVSEPDLGRVYFGMTAKIQTDTEGAPTYTGKIGFISPVAEFTPKTVQTTQLRTDLVYRLRIYVDNPDRVLKQGMPVTVILNTSSQEKNQQ